MIRQGVPAAAIGALSLRMGTSKEFLLSSLGLSRATINRKEKEASVLSRDESERVLGVETLIGMVQAMVEESGEPQGFDAAHCVADWLGKPVPALAAPPRPITWIPSRVRNWSPGCSRKARAVRTHERIGLAHRG